MINKPSVEELEKKIPVRFIIVNAIAKRSREIASGAKIRINTSEGRVTVTPGSPAILRVGLALRQKMQDGVHTSRIPGLITTSQGTLIALYDARWERERDLQGDIDICINRSTDGGRTWGPMQQVLDMGSWVACLNVITE